MGINGSITYISIFFFKLDKMNAKVTNFLYDFSEAARETKARNRSKALKIPPILSGIIALYSNRRSLAMDALQELQGPL